MEYRTIFTIKESEKATVELADVEGMKVPVIVKRLRGASPDIYRLLCCTQNSHVPQVFACKQQGEELVVVEEYVDGENLEEYLKNHQLGDDEKLGLAIQLCEAVSFLHSMVPSVIHRDIKPSNIVITGKGVLKLIDFDASRQYKEFSNEEDTRLLGTRGYAAPEQFGYAQTDVRSDIYSMGIVFHEIKLKEHKKTVSQWEKIAEKCTSFDPKNRYQSVAELLEEIKKLKDWKKLRRQKLFIWFAVLLVVSLVAGVLIFGMWNQRGQETDGQNVSATDTPVPTLIPEPTPSLSPTPTATLTPEPTPSPSPTPTATLTPEPTPTLSPTPTATLTPEPTPRPTPTATPEPTPTLSPTPTATLTPEPIPSLSPTPTVTLAPELSPIPTDIDHHYYKGLEEETELIFHHGSDNSQLPAKWDIEGYDYATGKTYDIPMEEIEIGPGYIRVKDKGLAQLEPSVYNFTVNMYYGAIEWKYSINRVIQVHSETEYPEETSKPMREALNYFYKDAPHDLVKEVRSSESSRFSGVWAEMEGLELMEVSPEWYNMFCDDKVLIIKKEFLLEYYKEGHQIQLIFRFDDGKQQSEKVIYEANSPWLNND